MKKLLLCCCAVMLMAMCAAVLVGCGGGGSSADGGMGRITLGITDAPVDGATAVVVKFTAIELKPESGEAFTIDLSPAPSVDVLALAGGGSRELLSEHAVPAGRYTWMRLLIDAQQNTPT